MPLNTYDFKLVTLYLYPAKSLHVTQRKILDEYDRHVCFCQLVFQKRFIQSAHSMDSLQVLDLLSLSIWRILGTARQVRSHP